MLLVEPVSYSEIFCILGIASVFALACTSLLFTGAMSLRMLSTHSSLGLSNRKLTPSRGAPLPNRVLPPRTLRVNDRRTYGSNNVVKSSVDDTVAAAKDLPTEAVAAEVQTQQQEEPEITFYEGNGGSNTELAISILLGVVTLIYMPLTIASLGRRAWTNYKITNKRLIVANTSPLFKREIQISFDKIKEVRTAPRSFGAWGDMVIMLKDGSRLEMVGMEKYREIKEHIDRSMWTLKK